MTLGALLRLLIERLDGDVEAAYRAADLDFRPRFTPVFRMLAEKGPSSISHIAASLKVSHSAASQTVAQMIARGWAVSAPGEDARRRVVALTDQADRARPVLERQWRSTASAAADLNAELGLQLDEVVRAAIVALDSRPFRERMRR